MARKKGGWHRESARHGAAARGIKTGSKKTLAQKRQEELERLAYRAEKAKLKEQIRVAGADIGEEVEAQEAAKAKGEKARAKQAREGARLVKAQAKAEKEKAKQFKIQRKIQEAERRRLKRARKEEKRREKELKRGGGADMQEVKWL